MSFLIDYIWAVGPWVHEASVMCRVKKVFVMLVGGWVGRWDLATKIPQLYWKEKAKMLKTQITN